MFLLVPPVSAAPFIFVSQQTVGNVAIIDAATNTVAATIPVGTDLHGLVVNRSATKAYAVRWGIPENTVSFVDLVSHAVEAVLAWPAQPRVIALSADETKLYIAGGDTEVKLWVLDIASKATIATVDLPSYVYAIALDPTGKKLYLLHHGSLNSVVDLTTFTPLPSLSNDPSFQGNDIAVVSSTGELYVANPSGSGPFATPPAATFVTVIDTRGSAPVGRLNLGVQPTKLIYAPQTNRVYVAAYKEVVFIDPVTREYVASIPIPGSTPYGIASLSELNRLYVTDYWADAITVIDVPSASVMTTIPISGPGEIAVAAPAKASTTNYQGLWWSSPANSEPGWGISLAHQADTIFATWFTYSASGNAMWRTLIATKSASGSYSGNLYGRVGPPFNADPFDLTKVTGGVHGTGTLSFIDGNTGTLDIVIPCPFGCPTLRITKSITQQQFGPLPTCVFGAQPDLSLATNYTDMWWAAPAASESGWGMFLTHQGDTIFATWFTYDLDGQSMWLVATATKSAPGHYVGALYRTTGPPNPYMPFDASMVVATQVGSMTLTFTDGNHADFAYTVNTSAGTVVTQSKSITREVFAAPGTVCR